MTERRAPGAAPFLMPVQATYKGWEAAGSKLPSSGKQEASGLKVVIAPDSFKGSLSAREVALSIATGIRKVWQEVQIECVPLADGGEGTVAALVDATGGQVLTATVTGPLGEPVKAFYGVLGGGETAVIEMAAASGLPLVPPAKRDPGRTTTRGTGELIRAALDRGCRKFIVGIGGSATNDGGAGMAQALGVSFKDKDGRELEPGGLALNRLESIDLSGLDPRIAETEIVVACDVDNPLYGPRGASAVYGPQKGATPPMVEELDRALRRFAQVIRDQLGIDVQEIPGAGAAGGLGAGLVAFLGAKLRPGIEIVLEALHFDERLKGADLVITAEGGVDRQTGFGKAPSGVLRAASRRNVPVVVVGGSLSDDAFGLYEQGFSAIVGCTPRPMDLNEAVARTATSLAEAGEMIARLIQLGWAIGGRTGKIPN